jgi:hypothetical protein
MAYARSGLLAGSSPPHFAVIVVAALTILATGVGLNNGLLEPQRVNRAAKADALVSSRELRSLALKVPESDIAGLDDSTTVQAPVGDTKVFASYRNCLAPDLVLRHLQTERKAVGGKVVMLADGLQQSFSDLWRRKALVAPANVSIVVAHLFPDPTGTQWNADVIEFDVNRCAMSRTMISGDVWNSLLEASLGVEV